MADKTKLFQDLLNELPQTLAAFRDETKLMGKDLINAQLEKANLITRDEFDAQQQILEELIKKVNELEALIKASNPTNDVNN